MGAWLSWSSPPSSYMCAISPILVFVLSPQWSIYVPPHSLVVFAYGAGVVLLFGGTRLFRASLFPLLLLWFVNPIPHIFNVFVDLPLQRASAHVARAFAISLGQTLSPDQLRLMFTPEFGMFIAPGCNGIRGAVTMGFIALIAGYIYRFRWYAHVAVVACAVLLGYVFNFARLCILVLYYIVASAHLPGCEAERRWATTSLEPASSCWAHFCCSTLCGGLASRRARSNLRQLSPRRRRLRPRVRPSLPDSPQCLPLYSLAATELHAPTSTRTAVPMLPRLRRTRMRRGSFPLASAVITSREHGTKTSLPDRSSSIGRSTCRRIAGLTSRSGSLPVLGSHDTLICHSRAEKIPSGAIRSLSPPRANIPVNFSGLVLQRRLQPSISKQRRSAMADRAVNTQAIASTSDLFTVSRPLMLFSRRTRSGLFPSCCGLKRSTQPFRLEVARQQMTSALRSFLASVDLAGTHSTLPPAVDATLLVIVNSCEIITSPRSIPFAAFMAGVLALSVAGCGGSVTPATRPTLTVTAAERKPSLRGR